MLKSKVLLYQLFALVYQNGVTSNTKTKDATGKVEADAAKEAIGNWGLSDGIIACCFDTTSSNTGINRGNCIYSNNFSTNSYSGYLVAITSLNLS